MLPETDFSFHVTATFSPTVLGFFLFLLLLFSNRTDCCLLADIPSRDLWSFVELTILSMALLWRSMSVSESSTWSSSTRSATRSASLLSLVTRRIISATVVSFRNSSSFSNLSIFRRFFFNWASVPFLFPNCLILRTSRCTSNNLARFISRLRTLLSFSISYACTVWALLNSISY